MLHAARLVALEQKFLQTRVAFAWDEDIGQRALPRMKMSREFVVAAGKWDASLSLIRGQATARLLTSSLARVYLSFKMRSLIVHMMFAG